jgi:hypothetical protein
MSALGVSPEREDTGLPLSSGVEGNEQFQGLLWSLARRCACLDKLPYAPKPSACQGVLQSGLLDLNERTE